MKDGLVVDEVEISWDHFMEKTEKYRIRINLLGTEFDNILEGVINENLILIS